jgi:hypothetical protein
MWRRRWRLVLAFVLICESVSRGQNSADTVTGIQGIVTVSPTRPGPARRGADAARGPLPNAAFTVATGKGTIASFTTGADGRFHLSLQPGHYVVSLAEQRFPRPCGPFEVEVVSGKMTEVEWGCDTGMR